MWRWRVGVALALSACAEVEGGQGGSLDAVAHDPAHPGYAPADAANVGGAAGASPVASEAGDQDVAQSDGGAEAEASFDAAPLVFECVDDAATSDGPCKYVVQGSSAPCFATLDAACACLGCACQTTARLCLPGGSVKTPGEDSGSKVGGCPPFKVVCSKAAADDAAGQ